MRGLNLGLPSRQPGEFDTFGDMWWFPHAATIAFFFAFSGVRKQASACMSLHERTAVVTTPDFSVHHVHALHGSTPISVFQSSSVSPYPGHAEVCQQGGWRTLCARVDSGETTEAAADLDPAAGTGV